MKNRMGWLDPSQLLDGTMNGKLFIRRLEMTIDTLDQDLASFTLIDCHKFYMLSAHI
jgi:hypothetical protein